MSSLLDQIPPDYTGQIFELAPKQDWYTRESVERVLKLYRKQILLEAERLGEVNLYKLNRSRTD